MSINSKKEIKCPSCGKTEEITVWSSITVKDSPDLKSDLLSGNINMFRCSDCSYKALIQTPLLYHDEEKRLMISFTPCDDSDLAKRLFSNICETSKTSGELEKYDEYNFRFVTEYNNFLEKILIFDNSLNDKAVEVIKFLVLAQEPEKAENRICIFGKKDDEALEFMVRDSAEGQVYTSRVPISTYDLIWQQLRYSGVKPYSFGREMVNSGYADAVIGGLNNF